MTTIKNAAEHIIARTVETQGRMTKDEILKHTDLHLHEATMLHDALANDGAVSNQEVAHMRASRAQDELLQLADTINSVPRQLFQSGRRFAHIRVAQSCHLDSIGTEDPTPSSPCFYKAYPHTPEEVEALRNEASNLTQLAQAGYDIMPALQTMFSGANIDTLKSIEGALDFSSLTKEQRQYIARQLTELSGPEFDFPLGALVKLNITAKLGEEGLDIVPALTHSINRQRPTMDWKLNKPWVHKIDAALDKLTAARDVTKAAQAHDDIPMNLTID